MRVKILNRKGIILFFIFLFSFISPINSEPIEKESQIFTINKYLPDYYRLLMDKKSKFQNQLEKQEIRFIKREGLGGFIPEIINGVTGYTRNSGIYFILLWRNYYTEIEFWEIDKKYVLREINYGKVRNLITGHHELGLYGLKDFSNYSFSSMRLFKEYKIDNENIEAVCNFIGKHYENKFPSPCMEFRPYIPDGDYIIKVRKANLYKDMQGDLIRSLSENEKVTILDGFGPIEQRANWVAPLVKVKTETGEEGFVFGGYLGLENEVDMNDEKQGDEVEYYEISRHRTIPYEDHLLPYICKNGKVKNPSPVHLVPKNFIGEEWRDDEYFQEYYKENKFNWHIVKKGKLSAFINYNCNSPRKDLLGSLPSGFEEYICYGNHCIKRYFSEEQELTGIKFFLKEEPSKSLQWFDFDYSFSERDTPKELEKRPYTFFNSLNENRYEFNFLGKIIEKPKYVPGELTAKEKKLLEKKRESEAFSFKKLFGFQYWKKLFKEEEIEEPKLTYNYSYDYYESQSRRKWEIEERKDKVAKDFVVTFLPDQYMARKEAVVYSSLSRKSKKLDTIPQFSRVRVLKDMGGIENYQNYIAPWVQVEYKGKRGFMFGGDLIGLKERFWDFE